MLAIDGGSPTIDYIIPPYNPFGEDEVSAASEVVRSGVLSDYVANSSEHFFGGQKVLEFEESIANFYGVQHAITVNSWTSGLVCAIGAIDPEPFSEIIVPTWTMCATATAILHWNCIPVFADIDPDTFCISPASIESCISSRTVAIIAVDIAGHSCDYDSILSIASKHGLKVISDSAQSPYTKYNGDFVSKQAHIGGFSYNYHKHIHTGEGGVVITNDDDLAFRVRLIRNHGEACVSGFNYSNISNIVGHNFRLGEIESSIGIQQLKKLPLLVAAKSTFAAQLTAGLIGLRGLLLPQTKSYSTHSFYVYCMTLDLSALTVDRQYVFNALSAEGVPGLMNSFANLHTLPIFQRKLAYGSSHFPWSHSQSSVTYDQGICPVAEELHTRTFLGLQLCTHALNTEIIDDIISAFHKVWNSIYS